MASLPWQSKTNFGGGRLEHPGLAPLLKSYKTYQSPEHLTSEETAIIGVAASHQTIPYIFQAVLDPILDNCRLDGVAVFSQLSIYFRFYVKNYIVRRFHAMLAKWLDKPTLFRDAMRHTGTVISGSTALAFIIGADWESNDLDLWTPYGRGKDMMIAHLVRREGYTINTRFVNGEHVAVDVIGGDDELIAPIQDGIYNHARIRTVTKLSKTIYDKTRGFDVTRHIDVIESATEHPVSPVFRFHSSIVINWITADNIVVAYPELTFARIGFVNECLYMEADREKRWRYKYAERGVEFITETSDLRRGCKGACPATWRSTRDAKCMTVSFGDTAQREVNGAELQWSLSSKFDNRESYNRYRRKCENPTCPRYLMMLGRRNAEQQSSGRGLMWPPWM